MHSFSGEHADHDRKSGDRLESHHQVYVTLAINVAGALLLGVLIGVQPADRLRVVLGIGYLASFTTFSTFVSQVYHAMGDDHYATGFTLPLLSVVLGVVAVWVGVSRRPQLCDLSSPQFDEPSDSVPGTPVFHRATSPREIERLCSCGCRHDLPTLGVRLVSPANTGDADGEARLTPRAELPRFAMDRGLSKRQESFPD